MVSKSSDDHFAAIISTASSIRHTSRSPSGPGGSFLEGREALTVGLGFNYQINWEWDLSYTSFFGAGRYNLINDRDFLAANIKYSF